MSRLELFLLGPPRIEVDGVPVEINRRKAVALLAYLAVTNQGHSRDTLAAMFWPEYDQARARAALRRILSVLNKALGGRLEIDRELVALPAEEDFRLDVARFEALAGDCGAEPPDPAGLAEAAALYGDDFMAGFTLPDSPEFDEWQFFQREGQRRRLAVVLENLADYHAGRQEAEPAIRYTRRWLSLDPLHEPAHRRLMALYAAADQRAAALRQYEECSRLLEQELGVTPGSETKALYEQIRAGKGPVTPAGNGQPLPPPASPAAPAPGNGREKEPAVPVFVARERELAGLRRHLDEALAGRGGQVVFIAGEAGSGKTALLQEFARQAQAARPDLVVTAGSCNAWTGQGDPYLPFREVLELLIGHVESCWASGLVPPESLRRLLHLRPAALQTLVNAGPGLVDSFIPGTLLLDQAVSPGISPAVTARLKQLVERRDNDSAGRGNQQALFEELAQVLNTLARQQPLLLLLDDFHWADAASIGLLFHLSRRLEGSRILLVLSYRPDEVAMGRAGERHPLEPVFNELKRRYGDVELDLGQAMEPHFIETLLETEPNRLGPEFRAALYHRTRGHPLFTVELLRAMQERGDLVRDELGRWVEGPALDWARLPARIEAVIAERIGRLEPGQRELLSIASVEGETFTAQVAARVLELPERQALRLLSQELEKRHFLVQERGEITAGEARLSRYGFTHLLIQEYLYQELSAGERRLLHGEVAAALEALYGGQVEEIVVALGRHYGEAGQAEKAVDYLLLAGDKARNLYAHAEAINFYRQALNFLKEQGLAGRERAARTLMKLGLTYHFAFDFKQARQSYEEGFALWQWTGPQPVTGLPAAPHPLRLARSSPPTMDPGMAGDGGSVNHIAQVFSGLMALRPEMEVVPELARSWEVLGGGREYVFRLRDDVTWSDGRPVTAEDFVYAWRRTLHPITRSPAAGLLYDLKGARAFHRGEINDPAAVGVRAPDPLTLLVELERPTGYFPQLMANNLTYPLPRHVVELYGPAWTEPEHIVTNGPFNIQTWRPGEWMRLTRNPAYRGEFGGNVQELELRYDVARTVELQAYEEDRLDVLDLGHLLSAQERDWARSRHAGEYVVGPGLDTMYLGFDASRPPFDDARVRRAFALATDRETLASLVMGGYAAPALGGFVPPGLPGHSPDIGLPYDPEQARRLLAEAGFPGGQGFPAVEWLIKTKDQTEAEYLQAQWRENLGMDLSWQAVARECLLQRTSQDSPQLFLMGWIADYFDSDNFLRVSWQHTRVGWQNETYTALVEQARATVDMSERLALHRQADRLLMQEAAIVPLAYMRQQLLVKPWVRKYPISVMRSWFFKDVVIEPH